MLIILIFQLSWDLIFFNLGKVYNPAGYDQRARRVPGVSWLQALECFPFPAPTSLPGLIAKIITDTCHN